MAFFDDRHVSPQVSARTFDQLMHLWKLSEYAWPPDNVLTCPWRYLKRYIFAPMREEEFDSKLCVVCQDAQKDVIFLPCRHMCACTSCARRLVGRLALCPVCRAPIRQRMEAFV